MSFKWLIVTEDFEVIGTNDQAQAESAKEWAMVIDVEANTTGWTEGQRYTIKEYVPYKEEN